MIDEASLGRHCVENLRGLKQGLDQATFEAAWRALRAWLRDMFCQFRGACIHTFARVVWEHAGTTRTACSSSGRPFTSATCAAGSGVGSVTLRPVFAVSDAFLKTHSLAAGPGVARAATLAGLKLQPTEDLNFIKLALKYSSSLTKDTAFRAIKLLLQALGEALGSGAHVSIDLGMGVLHGRDRRLEFEWKTEAMGMSRPSTAMLQQGATLHRPRTAASSVLRADGGGGASSDPWHGASMGDVVTEQQPPTRSGSGLKPTLRASMSGALQRSGSVPRAQRPGTAQQQAGAARGKLSSAPNSSTPTTDALPAMPDKTGMAGIEQQRPGGFEALADAGLAAAAAPKAVLHTISLHTSELQCNQDQVPASAGVAIPAAPAVPTPRPPTAFTLIQQQRRRPATRQQDAPPSTAMVAAEQRSLQQRLLRQAAEAAETAALDAHQRRLEEQTQAQIAARKQRQKELKAYLAAQIQEKVVAQQHERAVNKQYVVPATLTDNEELAASRKFAAGVWRQQLEAQVAERARVAQSTKLIASAMARSASKEAWAEAEYAARAAQLKACVAADALRADLAQQELDKRKRDAVAAWVEGASVAIVSRGMLRGGGPPGRSKPQSGAASVHWSSGGWELEERPWSRGAASVAGAHGAPGWWAMA